MNKEYHYLLMAQQDLLQNEVIEELIRERIGSYLLQNKKNDFWIINSPQFVLNSDLNSKIKLTNFYKQKKSILEGYSNQSQFYSSIISTNKEFIIWLSLRLGYFENLETFTSIQTNNQNYTSNGISGKINFSVEKNLSQNILKGEKNKLHPKLLISKYNKLIQFFDKNKVQVLKN